MKLARASLSHVSSSPFPPTRPTSGPRPSPTDPPEPSLSPPITVPCQSQSIRGAPSLRPTQCVLLVLFSEWLINSSTLAIFLPVSPAGSPGPSRLFTWHHPQGTLWVSGSPEKALASLIPGNTDPLKRAFSFPLYH